MKFSNIEKDTTSIIEEIHEKLSLFVTIHDHLHLISSSNLSNQINLRHNHSFCESKRHEKKDWFENCRKCCSESTLSLFKDSKDMQQAICWKGAEQIIQPVHENNKLIFTIFIGPFRTAHSKSPQGFSQQLNKLPLLTSKEIDQAKIYSLALSTSLLSFITDAKPTSSNKKNRNSSILKFLEKYHSESISLIDLASYLNLSSSRISHVLQKEFSLSFNELLLETRITKAKRLLLHSDITISEISKKIGFKNSSYFFVCFKKNVSISPKEFRNKYKNPV